MPLRMLDIIDETLSEIMKSVIAKTAKHCGNHDYELYEKLFPKSEPVQISGIPMYGPKFAQVLKWTEHGLGSVNRGLLIPPRILHHLLNDHVLGHTS